MSNYAVSLKRFYPTGFTGLTGFVTKIKSSELMICPNIAPSPDEEWLRSSPAVLNPAKSCQSCLLFFL
jgi:hypothetical protein